MDLFKSITKITKFIGIPAYSIKKVKKIDSREYLELDTEG